MSRAKTPYKYCMSSGNTASDHNRAAESAAWSSSPPIATKRSHAPSSTPHPICRASATASAGGSAAEAARPRAGVRISVSMRRPGLLGATRHCAPVCGRQGKACWGQHDVCLSHHAHSPQCQGPVSSPMTEGARPRALCRIICTQSRASTPAKSHHLMQDPTMTLGPNQRQPNETFVAHDTSKCTISGFKFRRRREAREHPERQCLRLPRLARAQPLHEWPGGTSCQVTGSRVARDTENSGALPWAESAPRIELRLCIECI